MTVPVSIQELSVALGGAPVLDRVSLSVSAGEFVTLLGPSGSGKTTTLNVVAGFVQQSHGHVEIGGGRVDDLPPHRRNIGFLFQNYALFPHMTVAQNIEFPLLARHVARDERRRLVGEALDLVQLPGVEHRSVRSLSGGQQQRVALARALVFRPSLLLLDEPLAALDKQLREQMQLELKRIVREAGTTTVAVTHDQIEAMTMSDRVAIMNQGRLEQVGSPDEVYHRPGTVFVARFLGEANLVQVRDGHVAPFGVPAELPDGTAVIRPEDIAIVDRGADGAPVGGRIETINFQGTRYRVAVQLADGAAPSMVVSVPVNEAAARLEPGLPVGLRLLVGRVHAIPDRIEPEGELFPASGTAVEAQTQA